MKRLFALSLCLLGAASLAAETLDLDGARREAAERSPLLRRLDALAVAERAQQRESLAAALPHLGLKGEHLFDARYQVLNVEFGGSEIAFPGAFPQDTLDLGLRWTLFDGFRTPNLWRAGGLLSAAADAERRRAGFQLRQDVAIRFDKALAAALLTAVAEQNVATLREHLRLAQASEDSGAATHVDVLRVQAQLEEAGADALQSQETAGLARLDLAQAMGLSQDARELDGALPLPDPALPIEGAAVEWAKRGDLEAQDLRAQSQRRLESSAESRWWPELYAFGAQQWYHYGNFDPAILPTDGFQDMYSVGVGLNWELYGGGAEDARHTQAQARAEAADQARASARLAASRDLEAWRRRYHFSLNLYQARQRAVDEYQESVRLAQLGLQAGTQTSSEVLDAETDLFRARAGLVQAQADAAEARLELELARGEEF